MRANWGYPPLPAMRLQRLRAACKEMLVWRKQSQELLPAGTTCTSRIKTFRGSFPRPLTRRILVMMVLSRQKSLGRRSRVHGPGPVWQSD